MIVLGIGGSAGVGADLARAPLKSRAKIIITTKLKPKQLFFFIFFSLLKVLKF